MAMSLQEKFEYWLDAAQYDLHTAEAMLASGRWLYVIFMCQQAIEKLAKGLYTLYIDDDTPRIHNIRAIFEFFEDRLPIRISEENLAFFDALSGHYLNNRYPDFKRKLNSQADEAKAAATCSKTQEAFAWLLTLKP